MPPLSFAQALKGRAGTTSANEPSIKYLEEAVEKEVHAFNNLNLLNYLNSVVVKRLPNVLQRNIFFNLEHAGRNEALCMRLQQSKVEARVKGSWVSIQDVLATRPIQWQDFRLLALPAELRNLIYQNLVGTVVYLYQYGGHHKDVKTTYWFESSSPGLLNSEFGATGTHVRTAPPKVRWISIRHHVIDGAAPLMGLLTTNKQVNNEANDLLWKEMDFRFQTLFYDNDDIPSNLERFGTALSTVHRNTIRHITIQSSPDELRRAMRLFASNPKPFHQFLPSLKLEIRLPHRRKYSRGWDDGSDWGLKLRCWRGVLGEILWSGRTALAHFDDLQLTGCISLELRSKFLQLLKDIKLGQPSNIAEEDIRGLCGLVGLDDHHCTTRTSRACRDDWCVCQGVRAPAGY
ncbi:hypothetical protein BU16DRAFT_565570 [Lophium mytilinum]|uniref:Uncharacterized protein n=1 Tax=Lophium mytilinum TaxID=390894 RepID=A0A6A6QIJ6_9PEZI|nr:hypothetical protein BU16DRAFT_565570 [Lophium mytilinum]